MRVIKQPDSRGFNEESSTGVFPTPSHLNPDSNTAQQRSMMSARSSQYTTENGVRIPLRIMVSRGFEEEKHPEVLTIPFLGKWSLISRIVLTAALGSFLFGFNIALLNTCLETISMDFHWCPDIGDTSCKTALLYKSIASTTVFVGGAIGAMTAGKFLYIGRRMAILLVMTVFCIGITSSVVATSLANLVWARMIVGYGVGVVSVVTPIYISEMSPSEYRGYYGYSAYFRFLIGLPLSLGATDTSSSDYTVPTFNKIWWRVMLGFGFIPVLICMYVLMFVMRFETPHYYVENNHENEARKILQRVYEKENVEPALLAIMRSRDDALEAQQNGLNFRKALKQPLYRRVIIVGITLAALQQLCGITVFIASSNDLLRSAHLRPSVITLASVGITFINFAMTIPALFLMDMLGRKTLMLIGTIGMGISVLPAAIFLSIRPDATSTTTLALAGSVAFIFFFAFTYGPVLWVYLFEIYPAEIKGIAGGVATAANWMMGIIVVFGARFLPINLTFSIFCVMSFLTALYVYCEMRETSGRSLENSPYLD